MQIAIDLALKGTGFTNPNPLVGAVIVKDDRIIGQGYHKAYGDAHAEVEAIKSASESIEGATMYVTLEPCSHHGKTPPCCEKIVESKIKKVYVSTVDPNPVVSGKGIAYLREHGVDVEVGCLSDFSEKMNEIFNKYITINKPFVLLKAGMTLDGKIATANGDSQWITSDHSRRIVHKLRQKYSAIMVGVNTVIADNPSLTCRLDQEVKQPYRIILDTHARSPIESNVFNDDYSHLTYLVCKETISERALKGFINRDIKIIKCKLHHGRIDLNDLMLQLGEMGVDSVLIEGGSDVHFSAIESGVVDKILLFIAPKIIGGKQAKSVIGGDGISWIKDAINIKDLTVKIEEEDILVEGYINRGD
jgi:diaminohydroxyphosphoribosylaminopyrimidine deaminase/5-amino-6-(5-phosphoribosylamino)uracil reductase